MFVFTLKIVVIEITFYWIKNIGVIEQLIKFVGYIAKSINMSIEK